MSTSSASNNKENSKMSNPTSNPITISASTFISKSKPTTSTTKAAPTSHPSSSHPSSTSQPSSSHHHHQPSSHQPSSSHPTKIIEKGGPATAAYKHAQAKIPPRQPSEGASSQACESADV
ncbi:MAG: hypothetical protein Q9168_007592, partial [Polycauliona sp. 1 TL-2023]